jgi:hypothetical protein
MNLFEEIVNESLLLNELKTSRDNDIKKAINNVLRVRISYDDKKDKVISKAKGKRERYILPVAYGITKNGKRAIRAYQTAGSTKRGVPKWKLFLLDNIYSWSNGKKSFKEYGDTLIRLGLNTTGDKHMTTLFAITPIGNENVPVAKDSNPIDAEPITKVDVQPTTQKVQNPQITQKTNDFVPSGTKRGTSIDNSGDKSYFTNKVEAPETEPITKTDVQPQSDTTQTVSEPQITTEPVTKSDIEGSNVNPDNKLTNSFKDMMNRMDNLNNDNEEEEK